MMNDDCSPSLESSFFSLREMQARYPTPIQNMKWVKGDSFQTHHWKDTVQGWLLPDMDWKVERSNQDLVVPVADKKGAGGVVK